MFTSPKNFVFGEVLFLSACICVCVAVYRLSQNVLDRFWWNLAGWCKVLKYRFLLKMGWICSVERIPRPFENLKSQCVPKFFCLFVLFESSWILAMYVLLDILFLLFLCESYPTLNLYTYKNTFRGEHFDSLFLAFERWRLLITSKVTSVGRSGVSPMWATLWWRGFVCIPSCYWFCLFRGCCLSVLLLKFGGPCIYHHIFV